MSNITVQKGNGDRPVSIFSAERDPWRALRDWMRWDPFGEMVPSVLSEPSGFAPAFEVKETKEGFVFSADVPGIKESDLDVRLTQNRLTISGKRESEKQDKNDTYYTYERSFGSFTRTFTLPDGVNTDQVKADVKNGVLTVELPKRPELQPKKVAVKSA